MTFLILVSLLWAFSFGLIKTHLGGLDASLVTLIRLTLSLLLFLPFLVRHRPSWRQAVRFAGIGAVQYGLMYLCYLRAYAYLEGHQVALFTVFTPIYVAAIHDVARRRWTAVYLCAAAFAVAGGAVIVYGGGDLSGAAVGFGLMQLSNLCFAFGQVAYRDSMQRAPALRHPQVFGCMYAGAVAVAAVPVLVSCGWQEVSISGVQWAVLLYLGVLPSGVGFFLWNLGAGRVNAGSLAVMNNVKIPLAVMASLLVFHERPRLPWLLLGVLLMGAGLVISEVRSRRGDSPRL